jgi:hypothetical protein
MIGKRYAWKWHIEIPKYDKMKNDAKICNCRHVTKCEKNTKYPKNPIGF